MRINEKLREYIEYGHETQYLDFKGSCPCDVESLAKDIMAMSNIEGGGTIIIGVKEENGRFVPEGVSKEHLETYNEDELKDRIGKYVDPYVDFTLEIGEFQGKKFIIIEVREFDELPVICKRDGRGLRKGAIYVRTKSRRHESAEVSNSQEMRALIDLAVDKANLRLMARGYVMQIPEISDDELFKKQIIDLENI